MSVRNIIYTRKMSRSLQTHISQPDIVKISTVYANKILTQHITVSPSYAHITVRLRTNITWMMMTANFLCNWHRKSNCSLQSLQPSVHTSVSYLVLAASDGHMLLLILKICQFLQHKVSSEPYFLPLTVTDNTATYSKMVDRLTTYEKKTRPCKPITW